MILPPLVFSGQGFEPGCRCWHWQTENDKKTVFKTCCFHTKGGSIIVPLTCCLTGLDSSVLQIKTKNYQLPYSWFQTSQTGGQCCSDTSPFSIPLSMVQPWLPLLAPADWKWQKDCLKRPVVFILKGEVSLYRWPCVWLVWIHLFCKQKQKISVAIQLIPNQSNRRSMVCDTSPFSIPWSRVRAWLPLLALADRKCQKTVFKTCCFHTCPFFAFS